ncbi:MAG: AIR synthase-related protein [Bacteriovoracia bacterium]
MNVVRLEVRDFDCNAREQRFAKTARQHLRIPVYGTETVQIFWLKADDDAPIPAEEAKRWAEKVFCDPVLQEFHLAHNPEFRFAASGPILPSFVAQVRFLPGVTDNVGRSATEALALLSAFAREHNVQVYTGKAVYFYGDLSRSEVERVAFESIANPLIEEIQVQNWNAYNVAERFSAQVVPEVALGGNGQVETISLQIEDRALDRLSKERCWALTVAELHTIRNHYEKIETQSKRAAKDLPDHPTDLEIEIFAQSWSEHCKHKIFAAEIDYTESTEDKLKPYKLLGAFTVKSLFKSYIKRATEEVEKERKLDWLISVFSDNAGIVRFDPKLDLCIKVETHNSPSALDPYGGALTGIVGVNRDILGCGLGARPIANTDVFCFGPPDWPGVGEEKELPDSLKHPRRIFDGVHQGVEDGGNKSGIPTVNGAFAFHRDFSGKPLVFCGTVGALPPQTKDGRASASKNQKPGDFIVVSGGRIGKDGIHGATFSSMELTDGAPATAVQIGDPITQKRLADFLLEARDLNLYTSVTDNGAGGLSSSVGEMALGTGGARLDVTHAPVKYPGLLPYELVVSESQERMTFSVSPQQLEGFLALSKRRGVESTVLGEFNDSGLFQVDYQGKTIAAIDLRFLHEGLPPMVLKAKWEGPLPEDSWSKRTALPAVENTELESRAFHENALYTLLARWNIRSKEEWVRRYDHEVQAATVVKPFVGVESKGPGDAGVIWLAPHGGDEKTGVSISCGLQPKLARFDTYVMAQHALDEAFRNCVAVGADPDQVALIDNFCWPDPLPSEKNPDAHHKLAQLVRANHGLYDLAKTYGAPFVSGKDSMKNDFFGRSRLKEIKISVPPTVLVTALAKVPDVSRTVTSDFQKAGDAVYLVGRSSREMGGSELMESFALPADRLVLSAPQVNAAENLRLYRTIHQAMRRGLLRSCHDCSEGGMLVALAESAIGGMLGVRVDVENISVELKEFGGSLAEFFFNESAGRFVVSVPPEHDEEFRKMLAGQHCLKLGEVAPDILRFTRYGLVILDVPVRDARKAWKGEQR